MVGVEGAGSRDFVGVSAKPRSVLGRIDSNRSVRMRQFGVVDMALGVLFVFQLVREFQKHRRAAGTLR